MNQAVTPLPALTVDQQAGADAFFRFLMSDETTFTLSGGAGVGKTFLMDYLCKITMKEYETACALLGKKQTFHTLVFTATTNKAAEVLENSIKLPVSTIHSYMGLQVREDYRTGKTSIEKTARWGIKTGIILFIDEASMVDSKLYDLIMETFQDSKIIFVGDKAQMAPVNEKLSPAFLDVSPDHFIHLSQPVRNAGTPALVDLCAQLRSTVETGIFRPIKAVPGVIEYLDDTTMPQMLQHHFKEADPSARVLCYTNTRVDDYNAYIRDSVRHLPTTFTVGDVLVVAQTFSYGKTILNVEREVVVKSVNKTEVNMTFPEYFPNGLPYQEFQIYLLNKPGNVYTVHVPLDKDQYTAGIKAAAKKKDWPTYFEMKNAFADLRDKAACTVYKSQGSTYETVFIDIGNIGTSYDADQVARMLFVAASRATSKVYLYGELPPIYRGKEPS